LQVQATERDKDGVFVRIHSGVAFVAAADWQETSVRSALVDFLRPSLTTSNLGLQWQPKSGFQELDGLWNFAVAVRGKYLLVSDDPSLLKNMFANMSQKPSQKPAVFLARFHHARNAKTLSGSTGHLDRPGGSPAGAAPSQPYPQFFSDNLASFSAALSGVSSETIVIRDASDKVLPDGYLRMVSLRLAASLVIVGLAMTSGLSGHSDPPSDPRQDSPASAKSLFSQSAVLVSNASFPAATISYLLFDAPHGHSSLVPLGGPCQAHPARLARQTFTALAYGETHDNQFPSHICHGEASGCWQVQPHGKLDLVSAISVSCNSYFRALAQNLTAANG